MGVTKRVFQAVYIYVDVVLVHIKTRLDLLGIQTFRWDQRLGRQYSNLNRHLSTQEKQSQRQYRNKWTQEDCLSGARLPEFSR